MANKTKDNVLPKYEQIAADIAYKIVSGDYAEGSKIYARSSVGSQYGVSSETARRAMCVLADWDIVEIEKNSGVTIKSADNAKKFSTAAGTYDVDSDIKKTDLCKCRETKK